MSKRDDGGPAFPITGQMSDDGRGILSESEPGMSLLDYFAAHAPMEELEGDDLSLLGYTVSWNYEYATRMLARRKAIALEEGDMKDD
ncbi:MAG: hypothetical protein QQN63_13730 [Nitrosopumilus sp.]